MNAGERMTITIGFAMAAREIFLERFDHQVCEPAARAAIAAMRRCTRFESVGAKEDLRERRSDRRSRTKLFERQLYCTLATLLTS